MKKYWQETVLGVRVLLSERRYAVAWILGSATFFIAILLIPVYTTPGNDVAFQVHIWGPVLTVALSLLSVLNGLLISMQVYAFRHSQKKDTLAAGGSAIGVITAFFVSIFACAACYSTLLAFVGFGFATFFVKYRLLLLTTAFCVVLWSIYKNASRILGHCDTCSLAPRK